MNEKHSLYDDPDLIGKTVARGEHREVIGGLWEEIGQLQLDFLQSAGLRPQHTLLDIGCGSLRLGVCAVAFLDAGRYWGIDLNDALLSAGYEREIIPAGLAARLPRTHLATDGAFRFTGLPTAFDFAIAQSVFTHLPLNHLRLCLANLAAHLTGPCIFYATFFIVPEGQANGPVQHHPGGVITFPNQDPYHHTLSDLRHAAAGLPWAVEVIGDWNHPRAQQMVCFRRLADSASRRLSVAEAAALGAGADHYRAFVDPPERFDIMSASQFALLFQLGLRDRHSVLDFGCGSLRLGRLLIPFLRDGCYFGIDPNGWLIDEAIARELGESAVHLKKPRFDHNDRFDCGVFGEKFDFIMAQSIVTHTGPELTLALFASVAQVLKDDGLFVFSFIDAAVNAAVSAASPGWHYPHCVSYSDAELSNLLEENGLVGTPMPWFHPGASWHVAAKAREALPSAGALGKLNGEQVR
jgi:SAM-dependent methyltransferase